MDYTRVDLALHNGLELAYVDRILTARMEYITDP